MKISQPNFSQAKPQAPLQQQSNPSSQGMSPISQQGAFSPIQAKPVASVQPQAMPQAVRAPIQQQQPSRPASTEARPQSQPDTSDDVIITNV